MFFERKNPQTELDGLDKALEILKDRYEKKLITLEEFSKQCEDISKKRVKYEKQLAKENR